jgi:hypothetical protein
MCKCEDMAIWHMHLGGHSEVAHAGAKLPHIIAIDVSSQSVVRPWCRDSLLYKGSEDDDGLEVEVTG